MRAKGLCRTTMPEKSNSPGPLCYLCDLLFKFSLLVSVAPSAKAQASTSVQPGWWESYARERESVERPRRKSNPSVPLCYLCDLLFKFSLFTSVAPSAEAQASNPLLTFGKFKANKVGVALAPPHDLCFCPCNHHLGRKGPGVIT
jgi:hypothetical protein